MEPILDLINSAKDSSPALALDAFEDMFGDNAMCGVLAS